MIDEKCEKRSRLADPARELSAISYSARVRILRVGSFPESLFAIPSRSLDAATRNVSVRRSTSTGEFGLSTPDHPMSHSGERHCTSFVSVIGSTPVGDTMVACGDLDKFVDGELSPSDADAFRAHLRECERCCEALVEAAAVRARISCLKDR